VDDHRFAARSLRRHVEGARRERRSYRRRATPRPGTRPIGGYKPKILRDDHAEWLIARCREKDFTLSQLVEELQAVRGLKVDRHTVWDFVHAEGLSFKKKPVRHRAATLGRRQAASAVEEVSGPA